MVTMLVSPLGSSGFGIISGMPGAAATVAISRSTARAPRALRRGVRSVGFLVTGMILHGLTDPTTILATGGIDEITSAGSVNGFLTAATGPATILLIVSGPIPCSSSVDGCRGAQSPRLPKRRGSLPLA